MVLWLGFEFFFLFSMLISFIGVSFILAIASYTFFFYTCIFSSIRPIWYSLSHNRKFVWVLNSFHRLFRRTFLCSHLLRFFYHISCALLFSVIFFIEQAHTQTSQWMGIKKNKKKIGDELRRQIKREKTMRKKNVYLSAILSVITKNHSQAIIYKIYP